MSSAFGEAACSAAQGRPLRSRRPTRRYRSERPGTGCVEMTRLMILSLLLVVGSPGSGSAQTVPIPGPGRQHPPPGEEVTRDAPSIQALTAAGSSVYAGSFGNGIFRSDDRGRSWTGVNNGLGDPFILSLASAPDGTLYAGTLRAGVFRSLDGGKRWQPVNAGLKRLEIKALVVNDGAVYAGT